MFYLKQRTAKIYILPPRLEKLWMERIHCNVHYFHCKNTKEHI